MDYLAVAVAGFFGAIARKLMGLIVVYPKTSLFPVNTLLINLTGCFVLSFFMNITLHRLKVNPNIRLAFGTGFLGAYTTFSTFTLETVNLARNGHVFGSVLYAAITALGSVAMAWLGLAMSRYAYRQEGSAE